MTKLLRYLRANFGPDGPGPDQAKQAKGKPGANDDSPSTGLNLGRMMLWGWALLVIGVGGFSYWAWTAPLDQGVTAAGQVVVTGNRKTVQHVTGGIIAKILVKDGDTVKAGQPVIVMDTTQARSQLEIARTQWAVARAVESRLAAEREGLQSVAFPADLTRESRSPTVAQFMSLQSRLFESRRSALRNELATFEESIIGLQAQIRGLEASKASKEEQIRLLTEELRNQRQLAADGYLPRNRVSEQERAFAQLSGQLSEDIAAIARANSAISEYKMRGFGRQNEYRQQAETQLTDIQREVNALSSRIQALQFDLANTEVRAPVDGIVVGLQVHTAGGVIQGGAPLLDVVPAGEPLRIDANVPTQFIDKVHPDLEVDVLFPAFSQKFTPHVPAIIRNVSADVLTDPRTGTPYYRAQVVVTQEGMEKLKEHQIRAGMQAEVFIRTGERTALNYFIKPIRDRIRAAMTEE
ncbi:MAG: HlyD family type I secretion periplasmic adaptor subunit [Burkholderiaceae bacterium]|nr:HlyD family type I secretion periplasmic adaptor subunit [Burkholderiaceae bacterium]